MAMPAGREEKRARLCEKEGKLCLKRRGLAGESRKGKLGLPRRGKREGLCYSKKEKKDLQGKH